EILLVQESKYDVEFMLEAFEKYKLHDKIKVLQDGGEALDYIFATGKYSGCDTCKKLKVIILDVKLPKVDGLEVLQRIRANENTRMIPVVVFSSSTEDRDRMESYRLGANSYIIKPASYENFVNTVADIGSYWALQNIPA
ncbi:MAG: response regulator, partial [Syntrophales bacterium]